MEQTLESMRIVVTGAGGFLGPVLVESLLRRAARVRALIGTPSERARVPSGAECIGPLDICDARELRASARGADVVVHLAGPPSVAASFKQPAHYVRVHTEGTATVLDVCRAEGVGRLVYVSSAQVYGRPQRSPVDEDHPLCPRSPYGAAKVGAEKLIEAHVHAFGLNAAILRPFSVYGPGASSESVITYLFHLARAGGSITVEDLKPIRDYCFVSDVAEAIGKACGLQSEGLEVFNVGTMRGTSTEQLAALVMESLGIRLPVIERRHGTRPKGSEIFELIADNRRAKERLGWVPIVPLEMGLRITASAGETWHRVA